MLAALLEGVVQVTGCCLAEALYAGTQLLSTVISSTLLL